MNEKKEKNCPEQRKVKVDATPFTTPHNPPKQVSPSRRVPTNTMPFLAQMNTEEIMPAVRKLRTDSSSSDGSGEEGPDREAEIHFPDDAGSSQSAAATSVIPAATARSSSSSSSSSVGQTNVVENRTYINTLNGPLHIGPSLSVSNVQCHHGNIGTDKHFIVWLQVFLFLCFFTFFFPQVPPNSLSCLQPEV